MCTTSRMQRRNSGLFCQKSPIFYGKSPVFCKKKPIFYEKSPTFLCHAGVWVFYGKRAYNLWKQPCIYCQKSLIFYKKSPISRLLSNAGIGVSCIKRDLNSMQRALHSVQRALYSIQTALYSVRRALYSVKKSPICLEKSPVFCKKSLFGEKSLHFWLYRIQRRWSVFCHKNSEWLSCAVCVNMGLFC